MEMGERSEQWVCSINRINPQTTPQIPTFTKQKLPNEPIEDWFLAVSLEYRHVPPGVDTHAKTESKKEGRMKTGTNRALGRSDVRVPAAMTCFRHLAGRSAQAVEERTRELHPLELPNPAPFPPQNPVGSPPSKLENCAPTPCLKSCSVRNRSIRHKWLILLGFGGFLSDLESEKNKNLFLACFSHPAIRVPHSSLAEGVAPSPTLSYQNNPLTTFSEIAFEKQYRPPGNKFSTANLMVSDANGFW